MSITWLKPNSQGRQQGVVCMVPDGKICTRIRTGPKLSKIGRPKVLSSKTAPFGTKNLCRKERERKKKKD